MFADIILPINLPQLLTYGVPTDIQGLLQPGMRVEVALGKNKVYSGIVESLHNFRPENYIVKPIRSIIDQEPVVNSMQLQFWRWICQYYIASPGEVMQAALPAHLKLMAETRLEWIAAESEVYEWSDEAYPVTESLILRKTITISELRAMVSAKHFVTVLNELIEKEVVHINDSLESNYRPRKEKFVILTAPFSEEKVMIALFKELERAHRQLDVLMAYIEISKKQGFVRQADLIERSGATTTQIKALADKGVFNIVEKIVDRVMFESVVHKKDILFTEAQLTAYEELDTCLALKNVALLHGVTGSGKTLLYIHKIRECIEAGRQAVMLVPEIGLTTQLVSRLHAYFGESLGVYHSHFNNNERVEIWEKVNKGVFKIVVGPRSVLWLPYKDLGLIVVDEEHDISYKQRDPAPRFHARDAAIFLASLFQAKVILGSATPAVETLYNVQQNKYAYVALKDRYLGVNMPEIEVVNAKTLETVRNLGIKLLTPRLQQAITDALQQRKQVILFQNKRGYSPFMMCTSCGWVQQCNNCSVSLTYHKSTDKMHCHYCGQKSPVINICPACGFNRLVSKSFGTEKIEEEVKTVFPKARVARMDIDSMRGKHSMAELLDQLEKGKVDILVGTQMVVKGLDLASVAVVGILSADSLLSFPDFRVNERAFQLMEQVSGRSGRTDGKGKVLIQAYNLVHPVLQWVKDHDVRSFYLSEIKYREHFGYPPFTRLIKISFKHKEEQNAITVANQMAQALQTFTGITIQGPAPAIVSRVRNQFIHEIWLKCPRDNKQLTNLKTFLKTQKQNLLAQKGNTNVSILFDVDPM